METPISPKVIAAAIVGILLTAVVSNFSAITPDMLDFLGPWKLFWFGTLLTSLTALAAWWKTDPLRVASFPEKAAEDIAAIEASKQISLAATATDHTMPASTYPSAAVAAAETAPAEVKPILPA